MGSEVREVRQARPVVAGTAAGPALVLDQGLSFAMGFDVAEGRITDIHSSARGERLTGRVLVMPVGRGSSSASTSFAEALRLGTGPRAIMLLDVDEILVIGAIVARILYAASCPILVVGETDHAAIRSGDAISIEADGAFTIG